MEPTSHFVTLELKLNKVKIQVFGCFSHIIKYSVGTCKYRIFLSLWVVLLDDAGLAN